MPPDADTPIALDPDEIASQAFTRVRKGYEADEVRAYLVGVGSKVRDTQRRFADMERRLAELERRAVDPKDLDGAAVTALLGEETARVLESARQAAAETRTKAAEAAAATTAEADAASASVRADADTYAAEVRSTADAEVAAARTEADAYGASTREAADSDARAQRGAADAYAAEVRSTADTEVAELRTTAENEAAEMRTAAETVLTERTEAAEVDANRIIAEVEAYRIQVRDDVDTYASDTRAAADTYAADHRAEADAYQAKANADADQLGVDAAADVEALRSAADAELAARRQETDAEVEVILVDAKEQGRTMVQEARTYRERVIADLAERRRSVRAHLEDMAATRDALAVTLTDVTSDIAAAHRSLEAVVIEPRAESDPGIDRRALDPEEPSRDPVGVGELDAESLSDAEAEEAVEVPDDPSGEAALVEHEPNGPDETDEASGGEPANDADDIFARLRSQQPDEVDDGAPHAAGVDTAEVNTDEVDELDALEAADEPVTEALEPAEEAEPDAEDADAEPADPSHEEDANLLDLRDATTDEVERQLARRLKRVLSDEQNEALDLLRRAKGTPSEEEVIPTEADHLARYTSAAREDLLAAERAGAGFFGDAPDRQADVDDVATEFATEMVRQIRSRLARAFEDGGDEQEVGERIRACYREWKTQRIADTARHYVVVAFSRGVAEAADDGVQFRWLVDDGDAPCPDCDDNALAGPTPKGDPFPTGDLCPPAHPGCRCLAVPAF